MITHLNDRHVPRTACLRALMSASTIKLPFVKSHCQTTWTYIDCNRLTHSYQISRLVEKHK